MRIEGADPALLARVQRGEAAAFERLCACIQQPLYAYIRAILRNHDDADEALQETLMRIYRHIGALEDLTKFSGWAKRIAVNQCHSLRARAAAAPAEPLDPERDHADAPAPWRAVPALDSRAAAESAELGERISAAIAQLPPRQRTAIALYEVEQRSVREIAELFGCSEGAVKFHLHEARKRLRVLLTEAPRALPAAPGEGVR